MPGINSQSRIPLLSPVLIVAVAVPLLITGCQSEEITRYKVKRPSKDRMLAAIAPQGEEMWSFKMDGSEPEVAEHVDAFKQMLRSLKVPEKGDVSWDLPEGWKQEPGKGMRFATLRPSPTVEVSVIKLPRSPTLANVNRWRGQMGLSAIAEADLPKNTELLTADGADVTLLDIVGELSATPRAPFAGGMGDPPPPAEEKLAYSVPNDWTELPTTIAFQKAAFRVVDGDKQGRITISVAGGDLVENINRWRGMLKLDPVDEEEVFKLLAKTEVAGAEAYYLDFTGPKMEDRPNRMIIAMQPRNRQMYFYKLEGPDDLVEQQKSTFEAFLRTLRFE